MFSWFKRHPEIKAEYNFASLCGGNYEFIYHHIGKGDKCVATYKNCCGWIDAVNKLLDDERSSQIVIDYVKADKSNAINEQKKYRLKQRLTRNLEFVLSRMQIKN